MMNVQITIWNAQTLNITKYKYMLEQVQSSNTPHLYIIIESRMSINTLSYIQSLDLHFIENTEDNITIIYNPLQLD